MRDDLPVIGGEFVIGRFGVRAIGEVVIEHAEIFHLADAGVIIRVEMARHQDLVDAFEHTAKGRCVNHVAQRFAHEQLFGGMQARGLDLGRDQLVFLVAVTVVGALGVVAAHPGIILEWNFAADDFAADRMFAVVEITQDHDGVARLKFFEDRGAQHPCFGHAAQTGAQRPHRTPRRIVIHKVRFGCKGRTGGAWKFAQFRFQMTVEHGHDLPANGNARLEDRARQTFDRISAAIAVIEVAERDRQRFVQFLQHLGRAREPEPRQDRDTGAAFTGAAVIGVGRKGEGGVGIGRERQLAKDRLAGIAFGAVGDIGLVCGSPQGIGFGDHGAQRGFVKDFLKADDIGVHRQQLFRQPRLFPRVFLGSVFFKAVVFLIGGDQVLDVETGDGETGHGKSLRVCAKSVGSTLPPVATAITVSLVIWSGW